MPVGMPAVSTSTFLYLIQIWSLISEWLTRGISAKILLFQGCCHPGSKSLPYFWSDIISDLTCFHYPDPIIVGLLCITFEWCSVHRCCALISPQECCLLIITLWAFASWAGSTTCQQLRACVLPHIFVWSLTRNLANLCDVFWISGGYILWLELSAHFVSWAWGAKFRFRAKRLQSLWRWDQSFYLGHYKK